MADKLTWTEIDLDTLTNTESIKIVKAFRDAKAAYAARQADLHKVLNSALKAGKMVPAGHEAQFSHKFGKVSVAFAPIQPGGAKTSKGALKFGA